MWLSNIRRRQIGRWYFENLSNPRDKVVLRIITAVLPEEVQHARTGARRPLQQQAAGAAGAAGAARRPAAGGGRRVIAAHLAAAPRCRPAPRRAPSCKLYIFIALHVIEPYVLVYSRLLFETAATRDACLAFPCLVYFSFVFAFCSHIYIVERYQPIYRVSNELLLFMYWTYVPFSIPASS